ARLEKADIRAYLFEKGRQVLGAVALEFYRHRLNCKLGNLTMLNLPVKMFRLLGYTPNLPPEESAHNLLFERLLSFEFDAIYMTCIRVDSFIWRYLQESPLIKKHFHFHSIRGIW